MHPRAPHRTGPAERAAITLAATVLLVAGCGDGDDGSSAVSATSTSTSTTEPPTTTSTPTSSTTGPTTSSTTTTTTTTPPPTTVPFEGGTARVELPRPAAATTTVHHTGLDLTARGGEERITFTFDGGPPGVVAEYVDRPVRESGSGDEVEVDGDQVTRTYAGPNRVGGAGGTVTEMVRTGDFEAQYEWAVGVTDEVPFRVETGSGAGTVTIVLPAG